MWITMWIQHSNDKPIYVKVRDKQKALRVASEGSFVLNGRKYSVVGFDASGELRSVINIFWKSEVWSEYDKLRAKVKKFKKTGVWDAA